MLKRRALQRFQQDDAHIFCREDQIEHEMDGCLNFLNHVYGVFGFEFELNLSTRPEKYLGEIETWNRAEEVRCALWIVLRLTNKDLMI